MEEQTQKTCELLIANRECMKSAFRWDGSLMQLACAGILTVRGLRGNEETLAECRAELKRKTNAFSNFRGAARLPVITLLAAAGVGPETALENGLKVYGLLKKEFWTSAYLPLVSMLIAQTVPPARYGAIAVRTGTIYGRMKEEHPFLTSAEDSAFCALMALSDKTDDALIGGAEECHAILRPRFFSANAVQSLSHALALCDGPASEKCARTLELFETLRASGCKYGTGYELPTLGVLAMSNEDVAATARKLTEIDGWLARQKGFGLWGGIPAKQRLMYAGLAAMRDALGADALQTAAVNGTISLIAAQQAAVCAAVASSSAAAAGASSSS